MKMLEKMWRATHQKELRKKLKACASKQKIKRTPNGKMIKASNLLAVNFLFNRSTSHEAIDDDVVLLTNTVSSIYTLVVSAVYAEKLC